MRHTHATHALARGAELTSVRDNLRHASIATTSIYLHGDDLKRAQADGQRVSGQGMTTPSGTWVLDEVSLSNYRYHLKALT